MFEKKKVGPGCLEKQVGPRCLKKKSGSQMCGKKSKVGPRCVGKKVKWVPDVWEKKIFHEIRKSLIKGDRTNTPCNECDVDGLLSGNEFKHKWQEYYQKIK